MALNWEQVQRNIFSGESGGDYDALFGYQNRPDGLFSNIKVSQMPVGDVIKFTSPSGEYGQYVKSKVGEVATPVGAYQVVGSTLRKAVNALGIDPSQRFDKATQDRIGKYILKTQGTGAWKGYGKGGAMMANQANQATQPTQPQQSQGLLGGLLGGQGIGGALGLSEDFRDRLKMGILLGSDPQRFAPMVSAIEARGQERRALSRATAQANATADYLERIGQVDLAKLLRQGGIDAKTALSAVQKSAKETADIQEYRLAQSQGYKGTFADWQQLGKKKTEFGTIPAGYQLVESTDNQGQPTYSMVPVKGSPDYIDQQNKIEQQKLSAQGKIGSSLSFYSAGRRILEQIDENPTLIPKTGVIAGLIRDTVFGQTQKNVAEDLAVMEAQMQFETLAQLKAQSPSGASGLGQLTDSERRALGKVKFNFDFLQGEDAIKRNIRSAMLFRSYFENGLYDAKTDTYRNATEEELDLMTKGINPFTQQGGPRLVGVSRYLGQSEISSDEGAQPDFSKMSDAELNAWIEENSQ